MRHASPERSVPRPTRAGLLKRFGQMVLWCAVALLLVRGAADVLSSPRPAPVAREPRAAQVSWPDDEARTFALEFTRAYLGWTPRHPVRYAGALERFVAPELQRSIVPQERASRQDVQAVAVARTAAVGAGRALVTVAATVASDPVSTRYLTVPVARDQRGGLVVYDLPSFAAPPARGQSAALPVEPMAGAERAQIEDVLERFFRAFLAGRADELEYLAPAGVRLGALAQRYDLVGLVSVALARPAAGRTREVLATVRARDPQGGAVYSLRYRLRLVRGDRWYVAAVNNAAHKGG
jgi:hypothetical protein